MLKAAEWLPFATSSEEEFLLGCLAECSVYDAFMGILRLVPIDSRQLLPDVICSTMFLGRDHSFYRYISWKSIPTAL